MVHDIEALWHRMSDEDYPPAGPRRPPHVRAPQAGRQEGLSRPMSAMSPASPRCLLASHALHEELGLTGDDCATIALVFAEASLRYKAQEAINKEKGE